MRDDPPEAGRLRARRKQFLNAVVALMAVMAMLKLGDEFRRLIWDSSPGGAVDLQHLHRWIRSWFAGVPILQRSSAALYPPATYILLWPWLGWISFAGARWLWGATSIAALAAIVLFALHVSRAETRWEKIFVALLLLSLNGTGVAIGNGQLILPVLAALLGAAVVSEKASADWRDHFVAACLLTWAMVKPSVAAPFLWVFVLGRKRWRIAILVLLLYAAVTVAAASFQGGDLAALFKLTLTRASSATIRFPGSRNVHALLVAIGLDRWMTLSSAVIFVGLGVWTYVFRRADQWLLLGVAALVARLWTYHRVYDDVLVLLPELALFRIAKQEASRALSRFAEVLLLVTALAMLCPARFLDYSGLSWNAASIWICSGIQLVLWLSIAALLINCARRDLSKMSPMKNAALASADSAGFGQAAKE